MQIRHYPSTTSSGTGIEDHLLRFEGEDSMEEMDLQVREAQKRLTALRAQQEEVERQKQLLENLRMKQERFVNGKKEMTEKLEKALQSISNELENTRRRVEDLCQTQRDFEDCLEDLKTSSPSAGNAAKSTKNSTAPSVHSPTQK